MKPRYEVNLVNFKITGINQDVEEEKEVDKDFRLVV